MLRRSSTFALLAFVVLAVATAACGGGKSKSSPRPPLPPTTTTEVPTTLDPNGHVLADLKAYYDTYYRIAAAPNPADPGISEHMVGTQLIAFRGFIEGLVHDGQVAQRGTVDRRFGAVSIQRTTAKVDECQTSNDPGHLVDAKTGRTVAPWGAPGTRGITVTLAHDAGVWKVAYTEPKASACS